MTEIRDFDSYQDAEAAVREAGFRFVQHSGADSWAPTLTYRHPDTGETVEVLWASDHGYIRRLDSQPESSADIGARNRRMMFGDMSAADWDEAAWSRIVD